jgi:hypothetical protein
VNQRRCSQTAGQLGTAIGRHLLQHRGRRCPPGATHRADAGRGAGRTRAAVATLGRKRRTPSAPQGAPRLLPVDGVPDRPHAVQRAGGAGPGPSASGGCRTRPYARRPGRPASPTPRWATAAWAGWRPVSWIRWPRWACPRSATASATNTACSRRRSRRPPDGIPRPLAEDGTPWEFPRWDMAYPVRFGGWVEHAGDPARPTGATPVRSTPRPTTW